MDAIDVLELQGAAYLQRAGLTGGVQRLSQPFVVIVDLGVIFS